MTLFDWRYDKLRSSPIQSFYCFSLIDNLASILNSGILPKNTVILHEHQSASFAEETVQERRHEKTIQLSNSKKISLHDLVPLYLTPRTPALSARREIQTQLFFIDVSLKAVCIDLVQFAFTDGNAGADSTKFYRSLYKLTEIPWEVVAAEYWNDYADGKRKRCCEFLVYPSIEPQYFERIVVLTNSLAQQCEKIVREAGLELKVVVSPSYFF